MTDVIETRPSSRPGIVIVAVIAILIVAGIAVWAVTREPSVERTNTSTTTNGTTTERYETQTQPPADNQGTNQAAPGGTAPPSSSDSTGY